MPKRVLDGEGFWGSRKLRRCPLWIRKEYAYLYALADCNGSFELDIPVILGKLRANRPDLSIRKLELVFETFEKEGLAFVWSVNDREYVHWTGSERVGRLPRPSRRSNKYEKRLAPPVPEKAYAKYLRKFNRSGRHPITKELRAEILKRDGALCAVCGSTKELEIDHILPVCEGGTNVEDNLRVLCKKCNRTRQRVNPTPNVSAPDAFGNQATATATATATDKAKETPIGFDRFWQAYPRKVGKPAAQRAWNREVKVVEIGILMAGLNGWRCSEQWKNQQFIPYPATFLNQRRWEDEPPEIVPMRELVAVQPQTGHCSECGAEIPAGFLKCLECMKKKAPVNP